MVTRESDITVFCKLNNCKHFCEAFFRSKKLSCFYNNDVKCHKFAEKNG